MNTSKNRILAIVALAVVVVVAFILINRGGGANATEPTPTPCVPSEAIPAVPGTPEIPAVTHEEQVFDHWQRYSWTGGPHDSDNAPAFPSEDWQPNVQGDPHGIGVEGAYFVSHGNSGGGDWFYLEAVEKTVVVIDTPAVPATPGTPAVPAVVCPEVTPTVDPTPSETTTVVATPTETPSVVTSTTPAAPGVTITPTITIEMSTSPSPSTPEITPICCATDPVISKETKSTPHKMVKILTHESGKVTREVKKYPKDTKEEGY